MPTASIVVGYVNQPKEGKKMGSIKTKDGAYYNVWPDKLGQFQPGNSYDIEYTVNDQGYKTFKCFSGGESVTRTPARAVSSAPAAKSSSTAEEMFAMGFVNRLYQGACQCPPQGELTDALKMARYAWRDAWAPPKPVIEPDDMNDEIPF